MKRVKNYRAIEIMELLKENGPLSFRGMSKLVNPPMTEHKLRMALIRLNKKSLVRKRNEKVFGGHGTFYQIPQDREDRKLASEILGCSAQALEQPEFRYRELVHSETCALWMNSVRQLFPEAMYIRDFQFSKSDLAKKIMSHDLQDMDLKPDLLMILPSENKNRPVSIALEIEKSRKSDKRLIRKLYKYANRSYIDGVIYVCEGKRIKEALQHVFKNNILHKARRIEHYPQNFFLFSDNVDNFENQIHLYNSEQKLVSFVDWTHYLQGHSFNQRRDQLIDDMGRSPFPYKERSI